MVTSHQQLIASGICMEFMIATGDASTRDMATSPGPHSRWWAITFRNEGNLSRVEESGEDRYLAGSIAPWMDDLGLGLHARRDVPPLPPCDGLSGNLAILIALIAFSCRSQDFDTVLRRDRAWRGYRWRGHHRESGRKLQTHPCIRNVYLFSYRH